MLIERPRAQFNGTNPAAVVALVLICVLIFCTTSCNQSLQAGTPSPIAKTINQLRPVPIDPPGMPILPQMRIEVTPLNATIASGGKMQFSALVRESADPAVRWAASAGTISSNGLFTAPPATGAAPIVITAVSLANPQLRGEAFVAVTVAAGTPPLKIVSTSLPEGTSAVPFDASLSATGGIPPYKWGVTSGSLPKGFQLNASGEVSGTTSQSGEFSFTAQVTDSAQATTSAALAVSIAPASNSGSNFDGPAELPRVYLDSSLANTPAPGKTISVNAGGDLQGALNSASCGDTITLAAGAIFSGMYQVPAKSCDDQHWIIVRTSAPDSSLPPEGTRLTPCYAGVASLPGRPAFQCASTQNVMAQITYINKAPSGGAIVFLQGANHYRFIGLEITRGNPEARYRNLIQTQDIDVQADHLVFDRMWIHGTASDETKGGIHLSGMSSVSIVDSYFTDFHCIALHGACQDSQAINGGTGDTQDGPFRIVNNFLEASGESIMLGGSEGSASPADIEIRYNHMFKPLIWQQGNPGYVSAYTGDPYIVKNNVELKNGQRILLEGNVMENVWGGFTQHGFSVMITPANQGQKCPLCRVTDVTFRYNRISHVGGGFGIATVLGSPGLPPAAEGARFSIHDMIIDDVDKQRFNGTGTLFLLANTWPANALGDLTINHVTGFPDSRVLTMLDPSPNPKMGALVFTNNLVGPSGEPLASAGGGPANCASVSVPLVELTNCFTSYTFESNVIIGVNPVFSPSKWPPNNNFPPALPEVHFVQFNNGVDGNYQLLNSSPYKGAGTDGKDIGADVAGVEAATSGSY